MEYVVETEKEIVQNYIIKSKQERIEWELNHPQKRKDIIWHFHKPDIFKEACLHPVDYMDQEAMKNYLHKLSSAENVYFIGEDYIGGRASQRRRNLYYILWKRNRILSRGAGKRCTAEVYAFGRKMLQYLY